jgi:hypothetical protein
MFGIILKVYNKLASEGYPYWTAHCVGFGFISVLDYRLGDRFISRRSGGPSISSTLVVSLISLYRDLLTGEMSW